MPAYMVGYVTAVSDPAMFAEYREAVQAVIKQYGGRHVAGGGEARTLEGAADALGAVILEFPSMDQLMAWYDSPEYKPLIEMRQRCATATLLGIASA